MLRSRHATRVGLLPGQAGMLQARVAASSPSPPFLPLPSFTCTHMRAARVA
jgi:hypothetical protein